MMKGHQDWVGAMCSVSVDGRDLLATASLDRTVRLWDPRSGEQVALMEDRWGIFVMCSVSVDVRSLLATGSDGTVRVWDPGTGEQRAAMEVPFEQVRVVCSVPVEGRDLLAVAYGRKVRVRDPGTGKHLALMEGHRDNARLYARSRWTGGTSSLPAVWIARCGYGIQAPASNSA